ncbi:hypothetical protein RRG08_053484 [Elysia crispata]|uniref:Uncharacterized protein n=1 Tax=Elysia crispata TaxID=231223 RepID=A0AAE1A1R9_9GAST|nr:hypothetical protein RRG08_053484 [Elysia crispata]
MLVCHSQSCYLENIKLCGADATSLPAYIVMLVCHSQSCYLENIKLCGADATSLPAYIVMLVCHSQSCYLKNIKLCGADATTLLARIVALKNGQMTSHGVDHSKRPVSSDLDQCSGQWLGNIGHLLRDAQLAWPICRTINNK